jgi:protein TonB
VTGPIAYLILLSAAAVPPGYTVTNTVPPQVPGSAPPPILAPPVPPPAPVVLRPAQERMPAQSLFSPDDYPAAAQGTGAHGLVRVTLMVDPSGRVTGCTIKQSSGSGVLDLATCNIFRRRARYVPPMNSNGQPVAGTIDQQIVWSLPRNR